MPQIAGLRGITPAPGKRDEFLAGLSGGGIDVAGGLASGMLVQDTGRTVYRYHQVFADPVTGRALVRKMVICAVRLDPWSEPLVKPHEAVPEARAAAQLAAIRTGRTVTTPVLAGYRDAATEVERMFRRIEGEAPAFEATTPDHTVHRLWRVGSAELVGQLRTRLAPKKLLVLDGHDRYEALLAYRDELAARQPLAMYSAANYALSCLTDLADPALIVTARPRVVRGGPGSAAALAAARAHFLVERVPGAARDLPRQRAALADSVAHQPAFAVSWAGEPDAWKLTLSPDVSPVAEGVTVHRGLQKLEPVVVDQLFAHRALPGATLEPVASGEAALAAGGDAVIVLRPLTIDQIGHVVDLGQVLPAGSSVFHPPLPGGLVSSSIDPDEDLV